MICNMKVPILENLLLPSVIDVLDDNNVIHSVSKQGERFVAELEFYSKYDGDQCAAIFFDYNADDGEDAKLIASCSFVENLDDYYESFNADEYVEMWLNAKHTRKGVCPLDARQLVEDADYIDSFLLELVEQLKKVIKK